MVLYGRGIPIPIFAGRAAAAAGLQQKTGNSIGLGRNIAFIGMHTVVYNSWTGTGGRLSFPKFLGVAVFVAVSKLKPEILVEKADMIR